MVKDAFYFLVPLLLIAAVGFWLAWLVVALLAVALAAFAAYFFRDPERRIPADRDLVVSPADGKVIRTSKADSGHKVVIFLSIFDVHVNRAPIGGVVRQLRHQPGRFHLAFDDRASVENEQVIVTISDDENDRELTFSLVAGLVARRIVPWIRLGDTVRKGDRIGLIRFGSRVDIFLPPECEVAVDEGQRVKGGKTILARWRRSR